MTTSDVMQKAESWLSAKDSLLQSLKTELAATQARVSQLADLVKSIETGKPRASAPPPPMTQTEQANGTNGHSNGHANGHHKSTAPNDLASVAMRNGRPIAGKGARIEQILSLLGRSHEPMTRTEVAQALGLTTGAVWAPLEVLERKRLVSRTTKNGSIAFSRR